MTENDLPEPSSRLNGLYEKYTGKDLSEWTTDRRIQLNEDNFCNEMKTFFDGGEAEAQYVFKHLLATGWITI